MSLCPSGAAKSCRLILAFRDEGTKDFVSSSSEERRGEQIHKGTPVDAGLADERNRLAQCLDGGCLQKISAELD